MLEQLQQPVHRRAMVQREAPGKAGFAPRVIMVILIVVAVAAAMIAVEALRPGRRWPRVRGWWLRALAVNAGQAGGVYLAGMTWDPWFRRHQLMSVASLGPVAEIAIGYAAFVLLLYWSHRARHHVGFLWRWMHQMHHSPQRIEILTAFYKHPLEIVAESMLAAALLYLCLGVLPRGVLVISIVSGVAGLFYHWNIATPRWLGYVVQRPESHCVHHQTGVHAYNYSELPLVDMLFGTFRNPARFDGRCGFGPRGETAIGGLLLGRDVGTQRAGEPR
jgi:sterol desaturase/sphingolipid hydroxylase (fatty acid hydroxylase superfamily)